MRPLSLLLLLPLVIKRGECLSNERNQNLQIVSTQKNGGHAKIFNLTEKKPKKWNGKSFGFNQFESAIRSTFLPSGYPKRTPPGYLQYSIWSWIQDLCTQLRSVLATQRVLEGVGVGREGATALSALMNYLVRDGCGMAATLLFTSGWSSRFRSDVKRWRIFADSILDVGITCEIAALCVPRAFFVPMISFGNVCKSICGVAAGACGGAINLHWAQGSDISDINSKFGAQHTVTGALGLIFAALFARSIAQSPGPLLWLMYTLLTTLHIFANTRCMRLIAFDSCNNARLNLLLREFFAGNLDHADLRSLEVPKLSTPNKIAKREPLFFGIPGRHKNPPTTIPIHFGISFDEFYEKVGSSFPLLANGVLQNNEEKYIISCGKIDEKKVCILVVLLSNATPLQETKAYFHATILGLQLETRLGTEGSIPVSDAVLRDVEQETKVVIESAWKTFQTSASSWNLGQNELRTKGYEVELKD